MGMHESQSRFFENMIGETRRSGSRCIPGFRRCSPGSWAAWAWKNSTVHQPGGAGPIRIDADELTYSLHIMIRYELEKALVGGEIGVEELPELWDRNMRNTWGFARRMYPGVCFRTFTGPRDP